MGRYLSIDALEPTERVSGDQNRITWLSISSHVMDSSVIWWSPLDHNARSLPPAAKTAFYRRRNGHFKNEWRRQDMAEAARPDQLATV